ncbi:hypothetical protein LCGC14_2671480, partial [marine sediment metagenome]
MLWVGQFGIVDGKVQEESPWIGLFPDSGRVQPEEAADLFVVVEPALPGSEDYCRDLSQAIGKQFQEQRHAPFEDLIKLVNVREGLRAVDLGCGTDVDLRDAPCELGEALFELLAVVVA